MPSQHSKAEASLRLLSIEKIKTSELELEIDDDKEIASAVSAELVRPKHEYSSTLIEFPARRPKNPEWRDEIKNRVRLSQERRRSEQNENVQETAAPEKQFPESKSNSEKSLPATAEPIEPALVIDLVPNIKENRPSEKIVARALERIQRSRQNFDGAPNELATFESNFNQPSEQQMAEVSVRNESRSIDSPLSLVNSKSPAVSVPPTTRRILPAIDDNLIDDLSIKAYTAQNPRVSSGFENIVPRSFGTSTENRNPSEEIVFDDLEDNESIEASLRSVRKITALEQTLAEQQPAERISAARQTFEDYAPLLQRLGAGIIDALLCIFMTAGLLVFLDFGKTAAFDLSSGLKFAGVFASINFLYFIPALMFAGTTVGLKIFRLQVVAVEDGMIPTLPQTILNIAVYLLSLATAGLGLLTIFFSSEKRALHDLMAGTVVIKDEG